MRSPIDCVQLTEFERRWLGWIGRRRWENAIDYYRDPGAPGKSNAHGPQRHMRGVRCEFAASLILNLYWRPTIGQLNERDIGGLVDVRSTVLPRGRLVLKPDEADDAPVVLIQEIEQSHRALGWMYGWEVKTYPLWAGAHSDPAHYAPQRDLRPLHELREWLGQQVR